MPCAAQFMSCPCLGHLFDEEQCGPPLFVGRESLALLVLADHSRNRKKRSVATLTWKNE